MKELESREAVKADGFWRMTSAAPPTPNLLLRVMPGTFLGLQNS